MKLRLIAAFIFLFLSSPIFAQTIPLELQEESTAVELITYDALLPDGFMGEDGGHCSGTKIGPHAILTAMHCLSDDNRIRLGNEQTPRTFRTALFDGADHVIYLIDGAEFTQWAKVTEREIIVGEEVNYWGYPGPALEKVPAKGVFKYLGTFKEADPTETYEFLVFTMRAMKGDSGAGVFDKKGEVIAVVSMVDSSARSYELPLQFTSEQLDKASQGNDFIYRLLNP